MHNNKNECARELVSKSFLRAVNTDIAAAKFEQVLFWVHILNHNTHTHTHTEITPSHDSSSFFFLLSNVHLFCLFGVGINI
jgi:hypothetical protein